MILELNTEEQLQSLYLEIHVKDGTITFQTSIIQQLLKFTRTLVWKKTTVETQAVKTVHGVTTVMVQPPDGSIVILPDVEVSPGNILKLFFSAHSGPWTQKKMLQ